jgi:hypothetical protein
MSKSDPSRPKRVAADGRMDTGRQGATADHTPGVRLRHRLLGQDGRSKTPQTKLEIP